jgi:hypothetical protein
LALGLIGGSSLGLAGGSTKESSFTTSNAVNVLGVIATLRPVDVFKGIKFKTHFAKNFTPKFIYLFCRWAFLAELSQEFSPPKQYKQDQ